MEDMIKVGAVASTHGVRGEVKVFPMTDDVNRFKKLKEIILDTGKGQITLEITQVKFSKNMVILKFKGYDNIDDVISFKGKSLYVTRDNAVICEKDEYFIADLIGLRAVTDQEEVLGSVKDVMKTGANDVYVIEMPDGGELLLPAIRECILKVDLEEKTILVHMMPGLREES